MVTWRASSDLISSPSSASVDMPHSARAGLATRWSFGQTAWRSGRIQVEATSAAIQAQSRSAIRPRLIERDCFSSGGQNSSLSTKFGQGRGRREERDHQEEPAGFPLPCHPPAQDAPAPTSNTLSSRRSADRVSERASRTGVKRLAMRPERTSLPPCCLHCAPPKPIGEPAPRPANDSLARRPDQHTGARCHRILTSSRAAPHLGESSASSASYP